MNQTCFHSHSHPHSHPHSHSHSYQFFSPCTKTPLLIFQLPKHSTTTFLTPPAFRTSNHIYLPPPTKQTTITIKYKTPNQTNTHKTTLFPSPLPPLLTEHATITKCEDFIFTLPEGYLFTGGYELGEGFVADEVVVEGDEIRIQRVTEGGDASFEFYEEGEEDCIRNLNFVIQTIQPTTKITYFVDDFLINTTPELNQVYSYPLPIPNANTTLQTSDGIIAYLSEGFDVVNIEFTELPAKLPGWVLVGYSSFGDECNPEDGVLFLSVGLATEVICEIIESSTPPVLMNEVYDNHITEFYLSGATGDISFGLPLEPGFVDLEYDMGVWDFDGVSEFSYVGNRVVPPGDRFFVSNSTIRWEVGNETMIFTFSLVFYEEVGLEYLTGLSLEDYITGSEASFGYNVPTPAGLVGDEVVSVDVEVLDDVVFYSPGDVLPVSGSMVVTYTEQVSEVGKVVINTISGVIWRLNIYGPQETERVMYSPTVNYTPGVPVVNTTIEFGVMNSEILSLPQIFQPGNSAILSVNEDGEIIAYVTFTPETEPDHYQFEVHYYLLNLILVKNIVHILYTNQT